MNSEWRSALLPAPGLMPADGQLHMFLASREAPGLLPLCGTGDLEHFTSSDGLSFRRQGSALRASEGAEWERAGLGGVQVIAGHGYRMLYTGLGEIGGRLCSAIGCAESPDLSSWQRRGDIPTLAPTDKWYERFAENAPGARPVWGDPFVLHDRKSRSYRAYISARRPATAGGGDPATRACIAGALSADTLSWDIGPPVYAPGCYDVMSAPLLLQRGDTNHLLFHVPESPSVVRICRAQSDSPEGPFEPSEPETFYCGRSVCVRPAAFGDDDMLLFVHAARRERVSIAHDIQTWPALLRFDEKGSPQPVMHPAITRRQGDPIFEVDAQIESSGVTVRILPRRGEDLLFSATVFPKSARRVGLLFRTSLTGRDNSTLWLDLQKREASLHNGVAGEALVSAPCGKIGTDVVRLALAAVGSFVAVYVNDVMVTSGSCGARPSGGVGVAVDSGEADFSQITLRPLRVRD